MWETIAKAFGVIILMGFTAWGGYLTTTVMDLSKEIDEMQDTSTRLDQFRNWNIKQEDSIKALDKRLDAIEKERH
jgi:hypothetical protein